MKLPPLDDNLYLGSSTIEFNRSVSPRYYRLRTRFEADSFSADPGQFAHLRVQDASEPLLRRPFSFHDIQIDENCIQVDFLYAVVGKGTRIMKNLSPGDQLELMGPLGNSFSEPAPDTHPVLVGGGVGVPPIHMLTHRLARKRDSSAPVDVLVGARNEAEVLCEADFRQPGVRLHIATEDGSRGYEGYVTELFEHLYSQDSFPGPVTLFGCGPHGMLDAIRHLAETHDLSAEIAIERQMGCALGVCRACVVKVRNPDTDDTSVATVCREGPVFSVDRLCPSWDEPMSTQTDIKP